MTQNTMPYDCSARMLMFYVGRPAVRMLTRARGSSPMEKRAEVKDRFLDVLARTEDCPGSPFRFNLVYGCLMIAILETFPDISKKEFTAVNALPFRIPVLDLQKRHSDMYTKLETKARTPYTAMNASDWTKSSDFSKSPDEFTVNYTSCGLAHLFTVEDKLEWLPTLCALDYVMVSGSNITLIRTKTLGRKDNCCNFRMVNNDRVNARALMEREGIHEKDLV